MSTVFTVSEIVSDLAARANVPAFGASTHVTSTRVTYWIAQAVRSASALMRQRFPDDRELLQTATVASVPDFELVSLPADCGEVHSVIWQRDTTDYVLLETAQAGDLATRLDAGESWESACVSPRWRLEGQTIALYPPGATSETLTVYYTTHLVAGATFTAKLDFDEWVTLDVLIKVFGAKDKPQKVSETLQAKKLLEDDLLAKSRQRETYRTSTIRDVRAERALATIRGRWRG